MTLFSSPHDEVVTSYYFDAHRPSQTGITKASRGAVGPDGLALASDRGSQIDLSKQFIVFQLSSQSDGPSIVESSKVEPGIDGSTDEPDVLVALEMLSFHIGESENVEPDTRATMRINVGKDQSSTDKRFDTLFWSIAAGLKLYNQTKHTRAESKEFKADFRRAFGNRPVEIPGGLGRLSFEVIKHKEPPWWKRIFGFLQSDTAQSLVSVLGFPAITNQAIDVLDELLNRLSDSEPEPLFKSLPMRLALSKYARDSFTGGSSRVKIGVLRQGFCVMARGGDFETLSNADVVYYPTYGKLVPQEVSDAGLITGKYNDPLQDVTYAVFRVGMKHTKLDPTFNFSA